MGKPYVSRLVYKFSGVIDFAGLGGELINVEDDRGRLPADWAFEKGDIPALKLLLDHDASVNEFRMLGQIYAGRYSIKSDVVECLRIILEARPSLKLDGADASSLFSQAARHGNYALIRLLLQRQKLFGGASLVSSRALQKIVDSGEVEMVEPIL